jgi:hypothetical protein
MIGQRMFHAVKFTARGLQAFLKPLRTHHCSPGLHHELCREAVALLIPALKSCASCACFAENAVLQRRRPSAKALMWVNAPGQRVP